MNLEGVSSFAGAVFGGDGGQDNNIGGFSSWSSGAGDILGDIFGSGGGGAGNILGSVGSVIGGATGLIGSVQNGIAFFGHADEMDTDDALMGGAATGLQVGSTFGPYGAAIGGVVGGIAGGIASLFGSDKSPEHRERDAVRDFLRENTPLGQNLEFVGFVGDGKVGTISLDGKHHQVDNSSGVLAQATGLTNVLAQALAGGNDRLKCEVSAMMLNAISGAEDFQEALQSVRSLMTAMGTDPEQLANTMIALYEQGAFSKEQLAEHLAYLDILASHAPGPDGIMSEVPQQLVGA